MERGCGSVHGAMRLTVGGTVSALDTQQGECKSFEKTSLTFCCSNATYAGA